MTQADTPDQGKGRAALLPGWMRLTIRVVELALLIALTGLVARLIWLVAFGASAGDFQQDVLDDPRARAGVSPHVADIGRLRDTSLFTDPRAGVRVDATPDTMPETRLALVLRGVRRGATPETGSAIIQLPDNRQQFFRAGVEILDGVTLQAVHVDHVRISRRGIDEALYLRPEEAANAREAAAGRAPARVSRAAGRRGALEDIAGLFQVRAQYAGETLTGYRVESGNEAMLSVLGLRTSDVITAIDDRPVSAISDLSALLDRADGGDAIRFSISRGGLPLTLSRTLPQ